jgi:putative monooxygenase ydhR
MAEESDMHVQIVNFNLRDLSDGDYRTVCDGLAPVFADVPGLISKVWLADEAANTYGGVYTWTDRAAMETFATSDLFKGIAANPNFANITSRDFSVLAGPTVITQARIPAAA